MGKWKRHTILLGATTRVYSFLIVGAITANYFTIILYNNFQFSFFYFFFFSFSTFFTTPTISAPNNSYKIINPKGIEGVTDLQKAAQIILETTGLDPESYRIGNTKACVTVFFLLFKFKEKLIIRIIPLTVDAM